jgi:TPR repeat protein
MTEAGVLLAVEAQQKRQKSEENALEVQARQWWERAAAKNDWTATARLGLFYQQGLGGLTKNDEQAEKFYQEAVKHENTLGKYWYALFLVEKKPDRRSEAENLMSEAATAGMQSARNWCEQNDVKFNRAAPADEQ